MTVRRVRRVRGPSVSRSRPVCGRCRHPGFRLSMTDSGRPRFTCDKCGNTWTCGLSGGEFLAHAMPSAHAMKG